jgi:hypothetical protein
MCLRRFCCHVADRTRRARCLQAEVLPEEWGGDTPFVEISAKKGTGINELLETVALVAEIEEFVANPDRLAEGTVLESHMDKQRGPIANLLVQAGTLRVRPLLLCCDARGRPRRTASEATQFGVGACAALPGSQQSACLRNAACCCRNLKRTRSLVSGGTWRSVVPSSTSLTFCPPRACRRASSSRRAPQLATCA